LLKLIDQLKLREVMDLPYAGWYVQMLGLAERGVFPIAYADWFGEPAAGCLPTTDCAQSRLPLPPGGEAGPGRIRRRNWRFCAEATVPREFVRDGHSAIRYT
jgi:hypothetical protein